MYFYIYVYSIINAQITEKYGEYVCVGPYAESYA